MFTNMFALTTFMKDVMTLFVTITGRQLLVNLVQNFVHALVTPDIQD